MRFKCNVNNSWSKYTAREEICYATINYISYVIKSLFEWFLQLSVMLKSSLLLYEASLQHLLQVFNLIGIIWTELIYFANFRLLIFLHFSSADVVVGFIHARVPSVKSLQASIFSATRKSFRSSRIECIEVCEISLKSKASRWRFFLIAIYWRTKRIKVVVSVISVRSLRKLVISKWITSIVKWELFEEIF